MKALFELDGPLALVTVADTFASTPREAGARMAVSATDIRGTIGGGHLEYAAIAEARELLQGAETWREIGLALLDPLLKVDLGVLGDRFLR